MSGAEQRKFPRVELPDSGEELVIQVQSNTGLVMERQVLPVDLSRNGMAFVDQKPLDIGTRCIMLIKHQRTCLRIIAKVAQCRQDEQGAYRIGLKFTTLSVVPPTAQGHVLTTNPAVGSLLVHVKQAPPMEGDAPQASA